MYGSNHQISTVCDAYMCMWTTWFKPRTLAKVRCKYAKVNNISHEEVNVIQLILSTTQCQLVTLRDSYTKMFKDLETKVKDTEELKLEHKKQEL